MRERQVKKDYDGACVARVFHLIAEQRLQQQLWLPQSAEDAIRLLRGIHPFQTKAILKRQIADMNAEETDRETWGITRDDKPMDVDDDDDDGDDKRASADSDSVVMLGSSSEDEEDEDMDEEQEMDEDAEMDEDDDDSAIVAGNEVEMGENDNGVENAPPGTCFPSFRGTEDHHNSLCTFSIANHLQPAVLATNSAFAAAPGFPIATTALPHFVAAFGDRVATSPPLIAAPNAFVAAFGEPVAAVAESGASTTQDVAGLRHGNITPDPMDIVEAPGPRLEATRAIADQPTAVVNDVQPEFLPGAGRLTPRPIDAALGMSLQPL